MPRDDATNGARPPGAEPAPTPEGRARLLTALDLERARHPVDPGQLGEYVELLDGKGLAATRAAFPDVAAHLAGGCDACKIEVRELRELTALDDGEQRATPRHVPPFGPEPAAAVPPATTMADGQPWRQRRGLLLGLGAIAAAAIVITGASLFALRTLAPGGGTGEVKLLDRETVTLPPTVAPSVPSTSTAAALSPAAPLPSAPSPASGPATAPPGQPAAGIRAGSPVAAAAAAPLDADCPEGFPIKANRQSGIYHVRGGQFYDRTRPETCFATAEDAQRAGFRPSQR